MGKTLAFLLALALLCLCAGTAFALPELAVQGNLSIGSYGQDVSAVQKALLSIGLYTGAADGIYDDETRDAVAKLQRLLSVYADGVFGPQTMQAYNAAVGSGKLVPSENSVSVSKALEGRLIGIDPGHQQTQDRTLEAMGPDTDRTKARMSAGAKGVKTGAEEYSVNLQIALKLQTLLEEAGAVVVMTRTTNDVSVSNRERAEMMNEAGVEVWIRLHCDASSSADQSGARILVPSRSNNASIYRESLLLGKAVVENFCRVTGAKKRTVSTRTDQTGFNWSAVPVAAIEMGYLSNAIDDSKLNSDAYQAACAQGIFDGLAEYFMQKTE